MERDLELIRKILLEAEKGDYDNYIWIKDMAISESHSKEKIGYHLKLLQEAGYIEAQISSVMRGGYTGEYIERITWEGQEFLDSIKNDKVWNKIKEKIQKFGSSTTIHVVKSLGEEISKQYFLDQ